MSMLRLPAKLESLELFRSFVMGKIEEEPGMESIIAGVDLVLEEVLVNIVNYAYADEGGYIEVECDTSDPEKFCIVVRDWGGAFNLLDHPEPNRKEDISEMQVGGLGIFLVRQITSEMKYARQAGANILELIFGKDTAWQPDPRE